MWRPGVQQATDRTDIAQQGRKVARFTPDRGRICKTPDEMVRRSVRTRCLTIHSSYQCQHRGACCAAAWEIDLDPAVVSTIQTGRIIPLLTTAVPFVAAPDAPPGGWRPARTADHVCGFRVAQRCSLQVAGGESMLPSACRHFPRVYLQDERGLLVTLSHYCPTAASLLLDETPLSITDAHPPLALEGDIEGLDARHALPPLIRPGMLSDIESYAAWEMLVVEAFDTAEDVGGALHRVRAATERIRQWTPEDGHLRTVVEEAFATAETVDTPAGLSPGFQLALALTGPHPHMQAPADLDRRWTELVVTGGPALQRPLGRYMAACTFANWIAYRGEGLRSIVEWLHACYDIVRVQLVRETDPRPRLSRGALIDAFRASDYLVVHTIDSLAFGRQAATFEREP